MLRWSALLHETGLVIAHNQYHKHGSYIIRNADMRGFSRQDQQLLAFMIRGHRRKFPQGELKLLPEALQEKAARLCMLLRLAVLLNHGRSEELCPEFEMTVNDSGYRLVFPEDWLAEHPLTSANLKQEGVYLKAIGYKVKLATLPESAFIDDEEQ